MCGIVGYVGEKAGSADFCWMDYQSWNTEDMTQPELQSMTEQRFRQKNQKVVLKVLSELTHDGQTMPGTIGIGHTRWATHGEPSDVNAHPHYNKNKNIVVVHNGIIENYLKLKQKLEKKGMSLCRRQIPKYWHIFWITIIRETLCRRLQR